MALVFLPAFLRPLAGGRASLEVEGASLAELIDNLDRACPGARDRLLDGERLRSNLAVSLDGELAPRSLRHPVPPNAEVHFVIALSGG